MRVYALFFSIYKGDNPNLIFKESDITTLFTVTYPKLMKIMEKYEDYDSLWLLKNSHSKMTYSLQNRFPENYLIPCYLSLSELSIYEDGRISHCSHLSRDGVFDNSLIIENTSLRKIMQSKLKLLKDIPLHEKCNYGCNLKLCKFNKDCHSLLTN